MAELDGKTTIRLSAADRRILERLRSHYPQKKNAALIRASLRVLLKVTENMAEVAPQPEPRLVKQPVKHWP